MLNNRRHFLPFIISIAVTISGFFSTTSIAQTTAPFVVPAPTAAIAEGPLTVTDIIVDKTDKNAVVARDQAIIEARRLAFQRLAEKSMTPEAFKTYQLPDDKTIMVLVQDFEIKNEQISADRYVANFTVRFNTGISNYLRIPTSADEPAVTAGTPNTATSAPAPETSALSRTILLLPYFEDISGKRILWEDPNPWRDAWQKSGSLTSLPGLTVTIPLGDILDMSAGKADAIWSGDYGVLEKLRNNYNASDVVVTVANKSSIYMRADLYLYKDGKLEKKTSITPYTNKQDDKDSYREAVAQTMSAIHLMESTLPPVTPAAQTGDITKPAVSAEKITLDLTINFDTFAQWLEVQKRLAAISPAPAIDISGLSKNTARFTVTFDGSLKMFSDAAAEKGLVLNQPVIEVDESVLGSGKPTQKPVYELKLQQ